MNKQHVNKTNILLIRISFLGINKNTTFPAHLTRASRRAMPAAIIKCIMQH